MVDLTLVLNRYYGCHIVRAVQVGPAHLRRTAMNEEDFKSKGDRYYSAKVHIEDVAKR